MSSLFGVFFLYSNDRMIPIFFCSVPLVLASLVTFDMFDDDRSCQLEYYDA